MEEKSVTDLDTFRSCYCLTRHVLRNRRKSRIGVHQSKCFLLERSWLADSLILCYSEYKGQRLTVKNCRPLQDWVDGHEVARVRSSLYHDMWLFGTSVQHSAAVKKANGTLEILRKKIQRVTSTIKSMEKFPVQGGNRIS